jgi:hypothetical protein
MSIQRCDLRKIYVPFVCLTSARSEQTIAWPRTVRPYAASELSSVDVTEAPNPTNSPIRWGRAIFGIIPRYAAFSGARSKSAILQRSLRRTVSGQRLIWVIRLNLPLRSTTSLLGTPATASGETTREKHHRIRLRYDIDIDTKTGIYRFIVNG